MKIFKKIKELRKRFHDLSIDTEYEEEIKREVVKMFMGTYKIQKENFEYELDDKYEFEYVIKRAFVYTGWKVVLMTPSKPKRGDNVVVLANNSDAEKEFRLLTYPQFISYDINKKSIITDFDHVVSTFFLTPKPLISDISS